MHMHNWGNDLVTQHVTLIFGTLTPTGSELTEKLIRKVVGA